jgi:mannose-6-phosphate isomerase
MTSTQPAQTDGQTLAAVVPSDRPWGSFQQFVHNEAVTVKIITVAPLQRLSLQRHTHRDEFWQVIDGPADIEVGGHSTSVDTDGRAWIPRGSTHRLGNRGATPVRVLEIAFGHFDEDDIERLDDDYARGTGPTQVAQAHPVQT